MNENTLKMILESPDARAAMENYTRTKLIVEGSFFVLMLLVILLTAWGVRTLWRSGSTVHSCPHCYTRFNSREGVKEGAK